VALGLAAVTEAIAGRMQESMALFDQARDHAHTQARDAGGGELPQDLVRTAQTLVQAAAQTGHPGCAQGIVEWMIDASVGTEEERQLLASIVGSGGVPPALRTKVSFEPAPADSPYRFEFEAALKAAAEWRLSKALATFRGLKPVAGESPELFTNTAILCEMLGRPYEASEAWLTVAKLRAGTPDDAVEATGRAIASIDRLFEAAGATALNSDQAVQRFWRDAHAGRVHAANDAERAYVMYGNHEFGLPIGDTMV
jgi:alkylation response protein AidB-like acyl-CoA dehydrogenase